MFYPSNVVTPSVVRYKNPALVTIIRNRNPAYVSDGLKVAVNTIVPRSPFFAFCTPKYRLL